MIPAQLKELLLQSLEHEKGGVLVYRTALECAINDDLRRRVGGVPRANGKSRRSTDFGVQSARA